jgi:hypothetical protein
MALIWVHHQGSNFQMAREGKTPEPIRNLRFALKGFRDGRYRFLLWDTWQGKVIGEGQGVARNGELPLRLETLTNDVAIWVRP